MSFSKIIFFCNCLFVFVPAVFSPLLWCFLTHNRFLWICLLVLLVFRIFLAIDFVFLLFCFLPHWFFHRRLLDFLNISPCFPFVFITNSGSLHSSSVILKHICVWGDLTASVLLLILWLWALPINSGTSLKGVLVLLSLASFLCLIRRISFLFFLCRRSH